MRGDVFQNIGGERLEDRFTRLIMSRSIGTPDDALWRHALSESGFGLLS